MLTCLAVLGSGCAEPQGGSTEDLVEDVRSVAIIERFSKEREIQACMKGDGFEYAIAKRPSPPPLRLRWNLTASNVEYGYGITETLSGIKDSIVENGNPKIFSKLTSPERAKWIKASVVCNEKSGVGVDISKPTLLTTAVPETDMWVRTTFQSEIESWSDCLKKEGVMVRNFQQIYSSVFEVVAKLPLDEAAEYERDIATKDLACREPFNDRLVKEAGDHLKGLIE